MTPRYVDTTTTPPTITTLAKLLAKSGRMGNPNAIPSAAMLADMGGAMLDETATGEIPTNEAVFVEATQTYQQVYTTRTAEERTALAVDAAKRECEQRIFAVASRNAQANLSANCTAGLFDAAQQATYVAGVQWIAAMQAAVATIVAGQLDPADNANWPAVPAGVAELVEAF